MRYTLILFALGLFAMTSHADIATDKAQKMVPSIKQWVQDPKIVQAIKEQNLQHQHIEYDAIQKLDQQWRTEAQSDNKPLINKVMSTELSQHLKDIKERSNGSYTEIIIMDNKGLNVGQSDITSDYWQGDEDKWKKTYLAGPNAVDIGDIKLDESSQSFQSQISVPVIDPDTQKVIGAATVGVFVNSLLN